jgi:hypothetical protein
MALDSRGGGLTTLEVGHCPSQGRCSSNRGKLTLVGVFT